MSTPDPRRGDEPTSAEASTQPGQPDPELGQNTNDFPDDDPTVPQPDDERAPGKER